MEVVSQASVHNQQIERFWRDLFIGSVSLFYALFYIMEDILDPASNTHLLTLHYIFLPRVNHVLKVFQESYSHLPLRTARNHSPDQLWISGLAETSGDELAVAGALQVPLVSFVVWGTYDVYVRTYHSYGNFRIQKFSDFKFLCRLFSESYSITKIKII